MLVMEQLGMLAPRCRDCTVERGCQMDVSRILAELHQELVRVDAAIASLEGLAAGTRRRGRPPRWLKAIRAGKIDASGQVGARKQKKGSKTADAAAAAGSSQASGHTG